MSYTSEGGYFHIQETDLCDPSPHTSPEHLRRVAGNKQGNNGHTLVLFYVWLLFISYA